MAPATPRLDPTLTLALVQASLAAYADFDGDPVILPDGWDFVARFTGWDDGPDGGSEERFGLLLRASDGSGVTILAFRGTASLDDIWDDGDTKLVPFTPVTGPVLPTVNVEQGIYGIYKDTGGSMPSPMRLQVLGLVKAAKPTALYITGHSLGGALAQLCAFDLSYGLPALPEVQVITFASPRVGDAGFCTAYNVRLPAPKSIRVVNQQDEVPELPPEWLGYRDAGLGFPLWFERLAQPDLHYLSRHSLLNYQVVLQKALPQPSQSWAGLFDDATTPGEEMISQIPS